MEFRKQENNTDIFTKNVKALFACLLFWPQRSPNGNTFEYGVLFLEKAKCSPLFRGFRLFHCGDEQKENADQKKHYKMKQQRLNRRA